MSKEDTEKNGIIEDLNTIIKNTNDGNKIIQIKIVEEYFKYQVEHKTEVKQVSKTSIKCILITITLISILTSILFCYLYQHLQWID